MDLQLADQAYEEGAVGGPEVICQNMYKEPTPADDGRGYQLLSCPGLTQFVELFGPVREILAVEGLFDGDIFAVAGTRVIRINRLGVAIQIGAVPENGVVTMAATRIEIAICVAPFLYVYDGQTFTQVDDEDLPAVTSVAYINQRFILSDTNDRAYWTDLLDGASINGLNFLTAEGLPDKLVRVFSDGERVYAMGTASAEVLGAVTNPSSSANAYARLGSGFLRIGLAGPKAIGIDVDSKTIGFVGSNRKIYATNGYNLQPISTPYIENELQGLSSTDLRNIHCFTYSESGETHFVCDIPSVGTFAYGKNTQRWHRRLTQGADRWRAQLHVFAFGKNYVADAGGTKLYEMSRDIKSDAGLPISKEFTASAPIRSNASLGELVLDGFSDVESVIGMRFTDDGRNWTSFVDRNMTSPDFVAPTSWRRLGKTRPPRRIFHFRSTDDCCLLIAGARLNDGELR